MRKQTGGGAAGTHGQWWKRKLDVVMFLSPSDLRHPARQRPILSPAFHTQYVGDHFKENKKRLKCLNQEADEPAEFSLYIQQKRREPSLRESPGLLPGQGKGPCSPLPALSIRASCNSSELKGSLLSTIRSRRLSDYSLNTQGPPGTTSLLFP